MTGDMERDDMDIEKALTIRDPWAQAIVFGPKRIENRTRRPDRDVIGRYIAIHCGKTLDQEAWNEANAAMGWPPDTEWGEYEPSMECVRTESEWPLIDRHHAGKIIGVAKVVGYYFKGGGLNISDQVDVDNTELPFLTPDDVTEDPWWQGPIGWLLSDVQPLAEPVPARGMPGLWTIGDEIREQMEVQS